jgi:hypothetical protein
VAGRVIFMKRIGAVFRLIEKAAEISVLYLAVCEVMFVHYFKAHLIFHPNCEDRVGGQDSPATRVVLDNKEKRSEKYKGHLKFSHFKCGCFNEELMKIQYKCLFPIYSMYPQKLNCAASLF